MTVNLTFFLILFLTFVACMLLALVEAFLCGGKIGKIGIVLDVIVACVGTFYAMCGDKIGVFTKDEWTKKTPIVSILVVGIIIGLFGAGAGSFLYGMIQEKLKPIWLKEGDEEAAVKAFGKVSDKTKLLTASKGSPFYRVRAAAYEKLDQPENALAETAIGSDNEEERLRCVQGITSTKLLSDIVLKANDESVVNAALSKITDREMLRDMSRQLQSDVKKVGLRFEIGKRLSKPDICEEAVRTMIWMHSEHIREKLDSIRDITLRDQLFARLLQKKDTAELVSQWYPGQVVLRPPFKDEFKEFCCPDGRIHVFKESVEWRDLGYSDDDDMKARKGYKVTTMTCENCGYSYRVI